MLKFSEDHEWALLRAMFVPSASRRMRLNSLGISCLSNCRKPVPTLQRARRLPFLNQVKAASDIYTPVSGEITAVNIALLDDLTNITPDKALNNWLFKLEISDASDLDSLMDEEAYNAMIG